MTRSGDARSRSQVRRVHALALSTSVAIGAASSFLTLSFADRGLSALDIGAAATVFAAATLAATVMSAGWLSRWGTQACLSAATLALAIGYAGLALVDAFWGLLALRAIEGAGVGLFLVASESFLLARARATEHSAVMARYTLFSALGHTLGPLLLSSLLGPLGDRAAWSLFAASGAAAVAWVTLLAAPLPRAAAAGATERSSTTPVPRAAPLPPAALLRRIALPGLSTLAFGYFQASILLVLPPFLVDERAFSATAATRLTAAFALGMFLGLLPTAWLAERGRKDRLLSSWAALGAVALGAVPSTTGPLALGALAFVAGATLATMSPVALGWVRAVIPSPEVARATGAYNACYALGFLVGPLAVSALLAETSYALVFRHYAVAFLAFAVLVAVVLRPDSLTARRLAPDAEPHR